MRVSSNSSVSMGAALLTVLTLNACVTGGAIGPAPVPLADGVYSAGSSGPAGYGDQPYQRAIRFCLDQGRQMLRVDATGAAVPRHAGGEVFFRCVGPGEPGWKEPVG